MRARPWLFLGTLALLLGCSPGASTKDKSSQAAGKGDSPPAHDSREAAQNFRREWNRKAFVTDYEHCGVHDGKWDAAAKLALENFAQYRAASETEREMFKATFVQSVRAAQASGCADPFLKCIWSHFASPAGQPGTFAAVQQFRPLAEVLVRDSRRSAAVKYFAAILAVESDHHEERFVTNRVNGYESVEHASWSPENNQWLADAKAFLMDLVRDKTTPPGEIYDAWELFFSQTPETSSEHYSPYLQAQQTIFTNWPAVPCLFLQKGRFYIEQAWRARGSGLADSVRPRAWQQFSNRLAIAEEALAKAWELDPTDARAAIEMITVELGQGRGRDRMELWFKRAMDLDPNCAEACSRKLHYLQPKWYGSWEDVFQFAAECSRSQKWGGQVPLAIVSAHTMMADSLDQNREAAYWTRPEVWRDLKQAYERFARLNPTNTHWRNWYVYYAYKAGQWAELNRHLPLITEVDYHVFGSKEEFDKIVQIASAHSVPSSPTRQGF